MKRSRFRSWGIILPISITGLLLFSSLKDETAPYRIPILTPDSYPTELQKAYRTLGQLFGNHGTLYTLSEISSDEMVIPARGGDWFDGGMYAQLHQHQFDPTNSVINNAWQGLYNGIAACNKLLFQYSKITDSGVNIDKAELRILRAFYYYILLDAFRNVPLITDYFPASPGLPVQSTASQLFTFIENEIASSLPDLSAPPVYGRFNQSAAKTLLAKLYLNADVYIATPRWNDVITNCDDVINSGYYNLTTNYFSNFVPTNNTSPEIIFQIPFEPTTLPGFNLLFMSLHYQSQNTFQLNAQPWNGYAAMEEFYNSFDPSDSRIDQFLTGPQWDSINNVPLTDPQFDGDPDGPTINFTPAINSLTSAFRQDGARIVKWRPDPGDGPNANNDFAIFRFADVVLMKAEAELRLGNTANALTLVNQIRTRASITPLASLPYDSLLTERGREFFAEAWRRQDLIRFGVFNNAWWEKSASSPHTTVFPIPAPQLVANSNLAQNPGY